MPQDSRDHLFDSSDYAHVTDAMNVTELPVFAEDAQPQTLSGTTAWVAAGDVRVDEYSQNKAFRTILRVRISHDKDH